ncbi:MAG: hypothetical protein KME67_11135 [Candidatus Thiodiazotropha sp. (ex Codakia orbicularis)]|nr:hypothetical protein [Candidatus Thiodiazotropha sp. (ex Codakia orbicularis)]
MFSLFKKKNRPADTNPINTYDKKELNNYFNNSYKCPIKWFWYQTNPEIEHDSDISIDVGGVPVNLSTSIFIKSGRWVSRSSRFSYAAWHFLDPNRDETKSLIINVYKSAGLNHLDTAAFRHGLTDSCNRVKRKHPRLSKWVDRRLTLLDLLDNVPTSLSKEFKGNLTLLENSVIELLSTINNISNNSIQKQADNIISSSLQVTTVITEKILSANSNGCWFSANLMIPSKKKVSHKYRSENATNNMQIADDLWSNLNTNSDKILIIVATTTDSNYEGFWVPDFGQERDIPHSPYGCNEAFLYSTPSPIFMNDLREWNHDTVSSDINNTWRKSLDILLKDNAFISIPIRVTDVRTKKLFTIAILNINIKLPSNVSLYRAYHQKWLETVQSNVNDFALKALYAYMIKRKVFSNEYPALYSGHDEWDKLI